VATSCLLALVAYGAAAQSPDVRPLLKQVANGWTADAKKALPDLLIDHPNDPAVLFLHASLVEEPSRAVPLYERVVDAFPKSEWADDALLRMIMISASRRDTSRARKALVLFRDSYPSSELLTAAADMVRVTVGLPLAGERKPATAVKPAESKSADPKPPTAKTTDSSTANAAQAGYAIQVGTYSTKQQADGMAGSFRRRRMKASVTSKKQGPKTTWAIMVGDYSDEPSANADVAEVRSICKCKAFVVRKP
jgi:SPOR domain